MSQGCHSFAEILDLAAHHLVWTGEVASVDARLRGGTITVRAFLRERYGVFAGSSERGDKRNLKRFRLWLADARWRIRKVRAEEMRRAWGMATPAMVM